MTLWERLAVSSIKTAMSVRIFPGRHDSLEQLGEFISEQSSAAGLNENDAYAVQLAVDEAAANIIEHAYGGEDRGDIECICNVGQNKIEVILKDKGKAFVPSDVPDLKVGAPLDEFGPGGAGLMLMHKLMDEVRFEFHEGFNILTMVKYKKKLA
jgi:serine/threonine-protein kinase RsbW